MEKNNRGAFSGNLGFILAAIGSAVGMGNLWGFPYKMGANGGFPFLVIYLTFVVFCGVIVLLFVLDDRPRTPEHIQQAADIPTLAVIPSISKKELTAQKRRRSREVS